jgi:hypothetical protein
MQSKTYFRMNKMFIDFCLCNEDIKDITATCTCQTCGYKHEIPRLHRGMHNCLVGKI